MLRTSRHRGPPSDHFDGKRFRNEMPLGHAGSGDLIRWAMTRKPGPWRKWTDAEPGPRPIERAPRAEMRVTLVNHATVLLQMHGLNVLTDPVWSERASPVSWAGPRRARPPGLRFEDLPPIDLVLVSHNHYDHLDVETLRALCAAHAPRIVTGLGNASLCAAERIERVEELDWWQAIEIAPGLRLTAVPAQHFSGRGLGDRDATLWVGFVLESTEAGRAYFAGDTGLGPHFERIRERLGAPRLALLPIGAFLPEWFMQPVHLSPREALEAHRILGASTSVAIHYGTFPLADDGQDEPTDELARALADAGAEAPRFWALEHGIARDVPPAEPLALRRSSASV